VPEKGASCRSGFLPGLAGSGFGCRPGWQPTGGHGLVPACNHAWVAGEPEINFLLFFSSLHFELQWQFSNRNRIK